MPTLTRNDLSAICPPKGAIEQRVFQLNEFRVGAGDDGKPKIIGHAAVFNSLSEDLGGFREKIAPGAFRKTIREADIRALINHDSNLVLGRNKSGTLKLKEDADGLYIENDPPDTTYANDLLVVMERGDVNQMSFMFQVIKDQWDEDLEKKEYTRTLIEVKLYDVSVVTFPAYPATDASVRSLMARLRRTDMAADEIRAAITELQSMLPDEPGAGPHSQSPDAAPVDWRRAAMARKLRLLELSI